MKILSLLSDKIPRMMPRPEKKQEDLADYLRRALKEKGLTTQEVQNRSERLGNKIAQSYLSKIISRKAGNLTIDKLRVLADAIGCSRREIILVAAGEETGDSVDFLKSTLGRIWLKIEKLPAHRREKMQTNIEMLEQYVDSQLAHFGTGEEIESNPSNGGEVRAAK